MINYERFVLENGLIVIVHEDDSTPMVAINVLYNVGARDENPEKTGFAHLFEHLMFGGSKNIPDFDAPIQNAGGDNNAFTNNDITNFYELLPAENIETALWLESDRMLNLNFSQDVLDVQRKVVVEEFKETCLNEPYGDVWHHLSEMAFKKHPYQWPTIGKVPKHVEDVTLEDVKDFFSKYYCPNNAILTIVGKIKTSDVKKLVKKWFEGIPKGNVPVRNLPVEPPQKKLERRIHEANVPVDALYLGFHIPEKNHPDYFAIDLLSDILCNGSSSRLYRRLLKEKQLFSSIDCYITGSIDPGLLMIEGRPSDNVALENAERAVWEEVEIIKKELISAGELEKVKNKVESTLLFSEGSILNKAMNLGYYELLGEVDLVNTEMEYYEKVTVEDIQRVAKSFLVESNCTALYYKAKEEEVQNV